MNSCAPRAAKAASKGITISSCTPSAAISSAFTASGVSSFGACWGATTETGWGSKVSTLSEPRDHLAVAEVHAVEGADSHLALTADLSIGLHIGKRVIFTARKPSRAARAPARP